MAAAAAQLNNTLEEERQKPTPIYSGTPVFGDTPSANGILHLKMRNAELAKIMRCGYSCKDASVTKLAPDK